MRSGCDNVPFIAESRIDMSMSVPAMWRSNRSHSAARVDGMANAGMDDIEIPAFLRKQESCSYALNCFNKMLYPSATNKPVRHPHMYRPLTLVTTEGARWTADRAQTIHVNIALGNLPHVLTTEEIETLFRHTWHDMAKQGTDIKVIEHHGSNWVGYSLKEAQQQPSRAWDTNSNWDVGNCWIPTAALNTD